jgi:hypothetical protein
MSIFELFMLTCSDTQTSEEIVHNSPDGSLELERNPDGLDAAIDWDAKNEEDVQPVDVLVPVVASHGGIGNMDLLSVRRPRARGLSLGRHGVENVNVWRVGERKIERQKKGLGMGGAFFLIRRAHLRPTLGWRKGFDRQRMYGEARRKANQKAFAVSNHKIPRSARSARGKGLKGRGIEAGRSNCFLFESLPFGVL